MRTESLSAFAESFYARDTVREACLRLQDEAGCDVPLILTAIWLGRRGIALSRAEWDALESGLAPWRREVVEPLRRVRRGLKEALAEPGVATVREQVQAAELAAEYRALDWLEMQVANLGASRSDAVEANLAAVLGSRAPVAAVNTLRAAVRDEV